MYRVASLTLSFLFGIAIFPIIVSGDSQGSSSSSSYCQSPDEMVEEMMQESVAYTDSLQATAAKPKRTPIPRHCYTKVQPCDFDKKKDGEAKCNTACAQENAGCKKNAGSDKTKLACCQMQVNQCKLMCLNYFHPKD